MKFEEILPAFRAGGEIRRATWSSWMLLKRKSGKFPIVVNHNDEQVQLIELSSVIADDWETTKNSLVKVTEV